MPSEFWLNALWLAKLYFANPYLFRYFLWKYLFWIKPFWFIPLLHDSCSILSDQHWYHSLCYTILNRHSN